MSGKISDEDAWEPRYGNDSRPWLLGFSETEPMVASSTTKETFTGATNLQNRTEGIRKQLLRKTLWEQMRKEVYDEMSRQEELDAAVTEYNDSFVKEGFVSGAIKTDPELHRKYPLYEDSSISLWREKFPHLPGATKAPHIQHQFRRYSGFTKPIDQTFDEP